MPNFVEKFAQLLMPVSKLANFGTNCGQAVLSAVRPDFVPTFPKSCRFPQFYFLASNNKRSHVNFVGKTLVMRPTSCTAGHSHCVHLASCVQYPIARLLPGSQDRTFSFHHQIHHLFLI